MNGYFVCVQCGMIDLIDLAFTGPFPEDPLAQQCTFCQTGHWHDQFPRRLYDPSIDLPVNRPTGLSLS